MPCHALIPYLLKPLREKGYKGFRRGRGRRDRGPSPYPFSLNLLEAWAGHIRRGLKGAPLEQGRRGQREENVFGRGFD